jgi:HD-GYP domain-containing protein (c-di-GMP phosphodiesterase class II)
MQRNITVNLGNLVLSLSDAMDLASPDLIQHQQRTAYVVWDMARAAKLPNDRIEKCFIAALLHDIGAFSLEEKISLRNNENEDKTHCIRGGSLLSHISWLSNPSEIIKFHHNEWQTWNETIENQIVFDSQLVLLADYLERQIDRNRYILHQNQDITNKILSLSGSTFNPQIVELFLTVSNSEEFWLDIVSPRLYSLLLNEGPFRKIEIDHAEILLLSELFRNIIDFRSRFTSTHSSGVSASAAMLSKIFGFSKSDVELMEIAGNLHDLGKLAVPNSILDKPGKLTDEEMAVMKSHTYYTYFVINTIGGLRQIAEWAAYHHEKLDGSGYPFHCNEDEISTGSRIMMVADIFTALVEDRPYRKGMSRNEVIQILSKLKDKSLLDAKIVNLLFENYDDIFAYMSEKQSLAREFYEKQFSFISGE